MNPFELLKKDHETVSNLFRRIESTSGREKLIRFRKLKSELELHAHIEETIFYPALKNAEVSRDITLEAFAEHEVIKDLLAELSGAKKPSDEWKAKLTVLRENVEHHVDEEEGELFSKAKDVLTDEQAEALGDQMAAEKTKQGGTVSAEVKKPGLIKTVVNALFGEGPNDRDTKKEAKSPKTRRAEGTKTSGRRSPAKKSSKRRSRKAGKTAVGKAKTKPARKAALKKPASKAKAA
jgi:iron-sulfur cluster repair protein YtfE (RIC family)